MKTRILLGILITFFITCSKNPADSSDVNYTLSNLVGTWAGTAKGTISLELNVDSEGKVSGSGVSSQWSIDSKGKVTGGGSLSFTSGSYYTVAGASWSLQLDSEKTNLSGEYDVAYPSLHNMAIELTKE